MKKDKIKYDWLKVISKKGVKARIKLREEENKKISDALSIKLKDSRTFSLLARLCGFIMGDGCLEKRKHKGKEWFHYEIKFYPDNYEVAVLFQKTFFDIYGKMPSIRPRKNYFCVRVTSPVACNHLLKFAQYSGLTWFVPNKILINDSAKREFARAIFDCEAYVGKRNVQFQSVNKRGINELANLLNNFKIESKIYSYKRKNPNWNINYLLFINKRESIKRFAEQIGFNHPNKQKKLLSLPACQNG